VVGALRKVVTGSQMVYDAAFIKVSELTQEMILAADIMSLNGEVLTTKGQDVTLSLRKRLENFLVRGSMEEPIKVLVPREIPAYPGDVSPSAGEVEAFEGRHDDFPKSSVLPFDVPSDKQSANQPVAEKVVLSLPYGGASEIMKD
jgi:hypothetical protein